MSPDVEFVLREWLVDRAHSEVPARLMDRVGGIPRTPRPWRPWQGLVVASPGMGRHRMALAGTVAAIVVVAAGSLALRLGDGPPSDPVVAAIPSSGATPLPSPTAAPSPGTSSPAPSVDARPSATPSADAGLAAAQAAATRAPRCSGTILQAVTLLRQALHLLESARSAGVPDSRTGELEAKIRVGLDSAYRDGSPMTSIAFAFPEPLDVTAMTVGPRGDVYYIGPASDGTGTSVWRLDDEGARVWEIIRTGDGPREGIATPRLLTATGSDDSDELLVVDTEGHLWRWEQFGDKASGKLVERQIPGQQVWGDDVLDIATLTVSVARGTYNLYVLDPSLDQILRYTPKSPTSAGFSEPDSYLSSADESVQDFERLFIDPNVYALTPSNVVKHDAGRRQDFDLAIPPDDGDLRPGHAYRLIDGTGYPVTGRLYVYDEAWDRILVFLKSDGSYVEQWSTSGALPSMADVRGMYVTQPQPRSGQVQPARVTWIHTDGIFESALTPAPVDEPPASPPPEAGPSVVPTPTIQ